MLNVTAKCGCFDAVKYLVEEQRADVNVKNRKGSTPLHEAAKCGHIEIVEYLVKNGAKVNVENYIGKTPLHRAAKYGHLNVIDELLKQGADVNVIDNDGNTPLHEAASYGELKVVKELLGRVANINAKNNYNYTSLHLAAKFGRLDIVKCLVDSEAYINTKESKNGRTPLHSAVDNNNLEMVQYFVTHGAFINTTESKNGRTPLHSAAEKGSLGIVKCLVKNGAKVDNRTTHGFTPLHYAAQYGHLDIVKYLITHKANINVKNKDDNTPLYYIFYRGNRFSEEKRKSVIKHIVLFHPSQTKLNFINSDAKLSQFWDKCSSEMQKLKDNIPKSTTTWYKLLQETDEDKLAGLIAESNEQQLKEFDYEKKFPIYGIELRRQVELGMKRLLDDLLLKAAYYNRPEEMINLIEKGANVNATDESGNTLSRIAAKNGHLDVVEALIREAPSMKKKSFIKDLILFHPSQTKLDFINANAELSQFWNKCSNEIKKIQNSTYGSILYKLLQETDENKLANLIRKSDKQKELVEFNYEEKFPIYGIELRRQVELGMQRLHVLNKGEIAIMSLPGFKGKAGPFSREIAEISASESILNLSKVVIQIIKDAGSNNDNPSDLLENSNAEVVVDQTSLVKHNSR